MPTVTADPVCANTPRLATHDCFRACWAVDLIEADGDSVTLFLPEATARVIAAAMNSTATDYREMLAELLAADDRAAWDAYGNADALTGGTFHTVREAAE